MIMEDSKFILKYPFPVEPIPNEDLFTCLTRDWSERCDDIALVDSSNDHELTFGQLSDTIDQLSRDMTAAGVRQKDVIAVWSTNCPEIMIVVMAAWKLGACVAMIGSSLMPEEAHRQLKKVNTAFVFINNDIADRAKSNIESLHFKTVFDVSARHKFMSAVSTRPLVSPERLHIHPDDTALIQFSGGTTGFPKAVELTHRNLVIATVGSRLVGHKMPTLILFLPLSHFYGLFSSIRALDDGTINVVMPRFDIDEYLRLVSKYQVYVLFLVPAVVVMLTKRPELLQKYDLSSVIAIFSSAAPLSPDIERQILRLLPGTLMKSRVSQGYGMTECTGQISRHPHPILQYPHECPVGSVGLVAPYMQLKIADAITGKACGPNTEGEIMVCGPLLMKGYLGDPAATTDMIDKDGWLHTGDIGYYDENFFLFIVDRAKELIKHNGMQVAPAELEDVLLSHPDVHDVAVVGLPDEESGELPLAFVVVKPKCHVTEAQLRAFVDDKVAKYKRLAGGVRFITSIPRLSNGKVLRRTLKESLLKNKL